MCVRTVTCGEAGFRNNNGVTNETSQQLLERKGPAPRLRQQHYTHTCKLWPPGLESCCLVGEVKVTQGGRRRRRGKRERGREKTESAPFFGGYPLWLGLLLLLFGHLPVVAAVRPLYTSNNPIVYLLSSLMLLLLLSSVRCLSGTSKTRPKKLQSGAKTLQEEEGG